MLACLLHCLVASGLAAWSFVHLRMPPSRSPSVSSRSTRGEIDESDREDANQYLTETKPIRSGKRGHDVSTAVPEAFDARSWNAADVWYATGLQSDGDHMRRVKDTVLATFDQKGLTKDDNFSTNETRGKYVDLVMRLQTDFRPYFVKDVPNFDKGIIWKLLSELRKAYVEKQKRAAQQVAKQSQGSNAQSDVEMGGVPTIKPPADPVCQGP